MIPVLSDLGPKMKLVAVSGIAALVITRGDVGASVALAVFAGASGWVVEMI